MAAGLSQKQITSRIYNRLKSLEYQLSKAGVNTFYHKGTRDRRPLLVYNMNGLDQWVDGGFNIKYSSGNMSNGETVIMAEIYVVHNGARMTFGWTGKDGSFEQGLNFIKQNFSTHDGTSGQDRKSYSDTQDRESYQA